MAPKDIKEIYPSKNLDIISKANKTPYKPFGESRKYVHGLKLLSNKQWREWCKSGNRPEDIPTNPDKVYFQKGWKDWGDWLGTERVATNFRIYRPFTDAKKFVHSLKLGSIGDWKKYCKRGDKPKDLPNVPSKVYQGQWKDWGDWLGTGTIAANKRVYRSFEEARQFVRSLGLKNLNEWNDYRKSPLRPKDIPTNPNTAYRKEWKGYADWLGTKNIASHLIYKQKFEKAREIVHGLKLNGEDEWRAY